MANSETEFRAFQLEREEKTSLVTHLHDSSQRDSQLNFLESQSSDLVNFAKGSKHYTVDPDHCLLLDYLEAPKFIDC